MTASTLVPIAGQTLEIQHIRVEQVDRVEQPRTTIVLLHEALGSVSHWRNFPMLLAQRCHADVLVYSRVGHGNSEGPAEPRTLQYFEQQALQVLPALLAHCGVHEPVLLGHSEGAAIALLYAVRHPRNVHALVLESPILEMEPAAGQGMALAEQAWQHTDFRERLGRHHRDVDGVFAAWLSIRQADGLLSTPLANHMPPLSCPLLVVQGEQDEYATARQGEALQPLAQQMEWIRMPDTGHTPHRERPEQMLELIAAFLARTPAQTRDG